MISTRLVNLSIFVHILIRSIYQNKYVEFLNIRNSKGKIKNHLPLKINIITTYFQGYKASKIHNFFPITLINDMY